MRRVVVLILVCLGLIAITGLLLVQPKQISRQPPLTGKSSENGQSMVASNSASSGLDSPSIPVRADADVDLEPSNLPAMAGADTKSSNGPVSDSSEARHQAFVETRTAELMDLAMNDDRESLNTILSELNNRDPQVRKAAVEAAVQFGSRDAIPNLMDAAAQTDDPQEKADIMEAIQFLKLPTLSEAAAQANQAQHPEGGTNAAPSSPLR